MDIEIHEKSKEIPIENNGFREHLSLSLNLLY